MATYSRSRRGAPGNGGCSDLGVMFSNAKADNVIVTEA
jgi:hypothetical protein